MRKRPKQNDYHVGYRKPPKSGRFKRGKSGNPKGRPKGSLNLTTELERELRAKVQVIENGVTRKIAKARAIAKQAINKAVNGDTKQISALLTHSRQQGQASSPADADEHHYNSEEDRSVIANVIRRIQAAAIAQDEPARISASETPTIEVTKP